MINFYLMNEDYENILKRIIAFRDDRDWRQFHNPKDMAISLVLEASEFLEHFQWKNSNEISKHILKDKQDISYELADVLYWVLLIAHDLDIDLKDALANKMDQNEKKYPVDKAKGKHTKYTEL